MSRAGWNVWVSGRPLGGTDRLAEMFVSGGLRAIAGCPGAWNLVAQRGGEWWVAVDAFAGVPLFVSAAGKVVQDPTQWRGALDPVEVEQHLSGDFREPWRTWWRDLYRVPMGWGGRIDGGVRLRRIWTPVLKDVRKPAAAIRAILERSVAHAAPSVAVSLSGGLDSSVVASLLVHQGRQVHTLSNRFPGWASDEGRYIGAVRRRHRLEGTDVDSRSLDAIELLQRFSPPYFPPVLINHFLNLALFRRTSGELWSGFGGDEVIEHGLTGVRELSAAGQVPRALWEAGWLIARERVVAQGVVQRGRRWLGAVVLPQLQPALRARSQRDPLRVSRFIGLRSPLLSRSREEQLVLASQEGIQLEMPFLNPELAALCLSLPAVAMLRRGRTRALLRDAFVDLLPRSVARRADKADLRQSFDGSFRAVLERFAPLLFNTTLLPWRSNEQLNALRTRYDRGDHLAGAALWRAIGAARWISWHTQRRLKESP